MKLLRLEQHRVGIIARALMPVGVLGGLTDNRDLGAEIGRQVALTPWYSAIVVRFAVWLVWFAPLWRMARLRTFGSLPLDVQYECLDKLARSNQYWVRESLMLMKLTTCMVAVGDTKVLTYLGAYNLAGGPVTLRKSGS
jgi:hypothetical protein